MKQREVKNPDGPEWILELRVQLVDSRPEIWRQLELPGSTSLDQVHQVLQTALGWEDAHLHRFTSSDPFAPLRPVNGVIPDALQWLPEQWCEEPTDLAEDGCSLEQLLAEGSGTAFYEYDFGDSWLHRLTLVSRRPADEDTPPARLVGGARRAPLEDSGGFPGYEAIIDALADRTHPDHTEYAAWVAEMSGTGEPFDPGFLDIAAVNRTLARRGFADG